jgi:CheY-like chemotaxis protein
MPATENEQLDVLVVDDDAPSANIIAELLRDEGYVVAESHQASQALDSMS